MAIAVPIGSVSGPIGEIPFGPIGEILSAFFAINQRHCAFCAPEEPLVGYRRGDVQTYDVAGNREDSDGGDDKTRV